MAVNRRFQGGRGQLRRRGVDRPRVGAADREDQANQEDDLTDDQYAHMRKVVGYINRHLAQRPSGDVSETPWRYSLMNWGHDPTR